jgi:amino acid permease
MKITKNIVCNIFFIIAFGSLFFPISENAKAFVICGLFLVFFIYAFAYSYYEWKLLKNEEKVKEDFHSEIEKQIEEKE